MIRLHHLSLHNKPLATVICGFSPNRRYMLDRSIAEMEVQLRGLPVEFMAAELVGEPWNECKCKNAAAAACKSNVLIFTNCDITLHHNLVESAIFQVEPGVAVYRHRVDEDVLGEFHRNDNAIGDFQAIHRVDWQAAKFDERMSGWGYLDYDFMHRTKENGVSWNESLSWNYPCHHWHPRLSDAEYRAMNEKNRSVAVG